MQYFIQNKFITSRQYGFRPGHSCETQLVCVLDDWTSALESGKQVDVIYLDLQKAFDKVPHSLVEIGFNLEKIRRKIILVSLNSKFFVE